MKQSIILLMLTLTLGMPAARAMDPGDQMQFADSLYVRGMYEMAVREYLALVVDVPEYARMDTVLFRLAESYRHISEFSKADSSYARLLAEHPATQYRFRAALRRAELSVEAKEYRKASDALKELLDSNLPGEVRTTAQYYLGHVLVNMGDIKDAVTALQAVAGAGGKSPFVSYACIELAKIYAAQKNQEGKIIKLCGKALENPATPRVAAEAWFQIAGSAFRQNDYETSISAYETLLRDYPENDRIDEARLQTASAYYHLGRFADALRLADESSAKGEESVEWLYLKANCERLSGKGEVAVVTYAGLLKLFPDHALASAAAYEKALIAFRAEDYEEAVRQVGNTPPPEELMEETHWLLAESYTALRKSEEAGKHYQAVLEVSPESERAPQACYRVARILREQGKLNEASRTYRKLVESYPRHGLAPRALFEAAYCMTKTDDLERAIQDWSTLVKSYPASDFAEESLYQKALAELRLQQDSPALKTFLELLEIFPDTKYAAQANYWVGILNDKDGNAEKAEKAFRTARKLAPEETLLRKINFRLASVLQQQGNLAEAADILQALVPEPVPPNFPPALLEWLALYQLEKQDLPAAEKAAARLAAEGGTSAWKQIGWYLEGTALSQQDHKDEARRSFALALNEKAGTREGAAAALQLGFLVLDAGGYEEANQVFRQAAELAASGELADIRAKSYYGLGRVSAAQDQWDEAARYYLSVGLLFDDSELVPECLYRAAEALRKDGKADEYVKTMKELEKRYPDSTWNSMKLGLKDENLSARTPDTEH